MALKKELKTLPVRNNKMGVGLHTTQVYFKAQPGTKFPHSLWFTLIITYGIFLTSKWCLWLNRDWGCLVTPQTGCNHNSCTFNTFKLNWSVWITLKHRTFRQNLYIRGYNMTHTKIPPCWGSKAIVPGRRKDPQHLLRNHMLKRVGQLPSLSGKR